MDTKVQIYEYQGEFRKSSFISNRPPNAKIKYRIIIIEYDGIKYVLIR